MARTKATTVDEYLAELPAEQRVSVETVGNVVLEHLPKGYEETMQYGMIGYVVPLDRYPATYNKLLCCPEELYVPLSHEHLRQHGGGALVR
jgi:hypothetical protein